MNEVTQSRRGPSSLVFVRGLQIETVIGVYDWERQVRQQLLLDLEMAWDTSAAAREDDVALALDYSKVSERLTRFARESDFRLIETFAERAAGLLQESFAISWLRLRVSKPGAVTAAQAVGVTIERGQLN